MGSLFVHAHSPSRALRNLMFRVWRFHQGPSGCVDSVGRAEGVSILCKELRGCRFCARVCVRACVHGTCQSASIVAAVLGRPNPAAESRGVEVPTKETTNSKSLRIEHVPAVVCERDVGLWILSGLAAFGAGDKNGLEGKPFEKRRGKLGGIDVRVSCLIFDV
jgi:hypothetical protein